MGFLWWNQNPFPFPTVAIFSTTTFQPSSGDNLQMLLRSIRQTTKSLGWRAFSTAAKDNNTFYALFPKSLPSGPPPGGAFKINKSELRREFLQLQAQQHPDKAKNNEESEVFAAKSAQLNTAYKTLLDPLRRAEHILLSRGIDALAEKDTLTEEDLLMEVLMAREAISEAQQSPEDLEQLKQENDERVAQSEQVLEEAFKNDDLETARVETVKLSYWQSIAQRIHESH